MLTELHVPRRLGTALLPRGLRTRLAKLALNDAGHGFDAFGAHLDWVALALALSRPLHDAWFRVHSTGIDNIPARGPAIVAANHSGTLPFDALMLWSDILLRTEPPRLVRPVVDHFVPLMPFVNVLFARGGAVGGSRGNVRALLEAGELLLVFPEGVSGVGKPFRQRYQLRPWQVGHAELAMRYRAPVVPAAVIGAEEQMPQWGRLGVRVLGAPYVPIALPFVLPVHYHILYGAPLALHAAYPAGAADDPEAVRRAAATVRDAVEQLIAQGLAARRGVFR